MNEVSGFSSRSSHCSNDGFGGFWRLGSLKHLCVSCQTNHVFPLVKSPRYKKPPRLDNHPIHGFPIELYHPMLGPCIPFYSHGTTIISPFHAYNVSWCLVLYFKTPLYQVVMCVYIYMIFLRVLRFTQNDKTHVVRM